jgi:phosphatidylserine decarboxylase
MPGRQAVKKAHARISQTSRLGGWLPSDQRHLNDWLETTIETAEQKQAPLHPVIREFQEMIESDPVMYMYFTIPRHRSMCSTRPVAAGSHRRRWRSFISKNLSTMRTKRSTVSSWNDFFIREFKPGMRPIAEPANGKAIVNACESAPFAIGKNVKEYDTFWIKSQPSSLRQMLDGKHVQEFIGGTIYQAFLSAENYHRWHSPVAGTVRSIHHVEGTYYAEATSEGFDEAGPNNSQGYLAHVVTRALIFIEADEPAIGLLCFIPIGMSEVSSCRLTVHEGQHVNKGAQIGYFQFGGSTHCLVFRKGVISQFAAGAIPQGPNGSNSAILKVNALLATAA